VRQATIDELELPRAQTLGAHLSRYTVPRGLTLHPARLVCANQVLRALGAVVALTLLCEEADVEGPIARNANFFVLFAIQIFLALLVTRFERTDERRLAVAVDQARVLERADLAMLFGCVRSARPRPDQNRRRQNGTQAHPPPRPSPSHRSILQPSRFR